MQKTPYFTVSTIKLAVISVCTFNLYLVYWFYKNWVVIKNNSGSDMMPWARALFSPISAYSCFKQIRSAAYQIENYKDLPIGLLAILYFLLNAAARLPGEFGLVSAFMFITLIPVNIMAMAVNLDNNPGYRTDDEFSTAEKALVWLGSTLWLLLLLGVVIESRRHG